MHLRRGLTADQIAEGLDIPRANAYTMLTRLRNGLYESVTYQLLVHSGRRQCAQLDSRLTEMRATELTRRSQQAILQPSEDLRPLPRQPPPVPLAARRLRRIRTRSRRSRRKTRVWQNVSAHVQGISQGRSFRRSAVLAPGANGELEHAIRRRRHRRCGCAALAILSEALLLLSSGGGGSTLSDPENVRATDRDPGDSSTDNVIEVVGTPRTTSRATRSSGARNPPNSLTPTRTSRAAPLALRARASTPAPGTSTCGRRERTAPGRAPCTSARSK